MNIYKELNVEELKYYYEYKGSIVNLDSLTINEYIKYLIQQVETGIEEAEENIKLSEKVSLQAEKILVNMDSVNTNK